MNYQGRIIDPIAVWSDYVDFPSNVDLEQGGFLPLVVCPNPDHGTTKRHFQVNADKPLVHCFAECGISGTYEHAISMIEGCTQRQARRIIMKHARVGKTVRKKASTKKAEITPDKLEYQTYLPQAGLDYMTGRGFSFTTLSNWDVGWNQDSMRVVIPAKDSRGRVKFLIERAVKSRQQPRYLYTEGADKDKLVFGLDRIDPGLVRSTGIVIVEGSLDTMMMHQHGFVTTVGLLTSKCSKFQARLISALRPRRIVTMFDADVAGIEATISVHERLPRYPTRVVRFPKGKTDPAQLTAEEAARAIDRSISFGKFQQLTGHIARSKQTRKEFSFGTH